MKYLKGERKLLGEHSVARQGKGREGSARCRSCQGGPRENGATGLSTWQPVVVTEAWAWSGAKGH